MANGVACLVNGKVVVIEEGGEPVDLESPYAEQVGARERALVQKKASGTRERGATRARVVGVTRGRVNGELCYAISTGAVAGVFAQKPGTRDEHRLFHNADVQLREIDFSFADEAFTCTVDGHGGTSAIGVLADDGKGVRTVTEGDVLDCAPRWVPGGVGEIVYASAGVGRTRSGAWAGRAPFSLHRLRMKDGTVEVLVSDAKYDYLAPVAVSDSLIYAIRRAYEGAKPNPPIWSALRNWLLVITGRHPQQSAAGAERMMIWGNQVDVAAEAGDAARAAGRGARGYELLRITPKGTEVVAEGVLAFDIAPNGDIVYSSGRALYRAAPAKGAERTLLAKIERVEQIVIW